MRPAARLRRAYFDSRYGQLHVHQAIPPGGGFDEAVPVLCLPGAHGRGRFFQALLAPLGADRSIYAPDLPGFGESDGGSQADDASAPSGAGELRSALEARGPEQYALACLDLLDSLRQRQVDIVAHAEGAETAIALAKLRPTLVRRLALSAASPDAVRQARALSLVCAELPLAAASDDAVSGDGVVTQLDELIHFFGAAKPPP